MPDTKRIERKHFFIDRKLQGRYMMTFLIPMILLLIFMIFTLYIASQSLINTAAAIVKDDINNMITLQLQDKSSANVDTYTNLISDIKSYLRTFTQNVTYRKAALISLVWIFGLGLFLVIIQLVFLTIFFSHKVAGPIYRFEVVCHNIIKGKYTDMIVLRRGDEMKNLAQLLNEVIVQTKSRLIKLAHTESKEEKQKIIESLEL